MRFDEHDLRDDNGNIVIKTFHSGVRPGKRAYNEHHHTECELSLFLAGRGVYAVHGKELSFCPGDMFLFGSDEAHCITEIHEELNLLNIHFEPRILWERSENIELLALFAARNKNFSNRFAGTDQELRRLILSAEEEMAKRRPGYRVQVRSLLYAALIHILRAYDCTQKDDTWLKNFSTAEKLKDAMLFIDRHLEEQITLREIADVACMTPTYFSSVFKKFNGISPWGYITIKRVEKAVEMLKHTDMNKLEIAEKCGFSSSSNFYKAFFKVTGKRPGDYTD
ncbi:MAG: helix-turn-helix transcriptional regulator [Clostridia bacterium]|nr:helix-turn-helix transcriptional regulator [Clostridia bacterium]